MKDYNSSRKSGGFGGGNKFKGAGGGGSRPSFGSRPQRSGFGGRDAQSRGFDRPTMYKATCSDCGKACEVPFKPTGAKPVLCSFCFAEQQAGGNDRSFAPRTNHFEAGADKKMFKATCKECGSQCEVPFRPVEGKTVLCDSCFRGNGAPVKSFKTEGGNNKEQLDMLNTKLDQILALLKPTAKSTKKEAKVTEVKEEVVEIEALEEEVEKPKKVAKPKGVKPVKK